MTSNYEEVDINEINLDLDNPRIKQYLDIYKNKELTAEQIAFALKNPGNDPSISFNVLRESIKVQGGIIHPIVVNKDSSGRMVVIEGNTRLQIYKDFLKTDPTGPWNKIRAIVYDNLTDQEIHAIRLQSHLVGPREWTPYSKAKYLNQLSNVDYLPMSVIVSMCGGNKSEIIELINAYNDFECYLAPLCEENGERAPTTDFSKFKEYQRKSVKKAVLEAGYSSEDFARWVHDKNIDTAQGVRDLPSVLDAPEAKEEFLKSNMSNAVKKLAVIQSGDNTIKKYSNEALMTELIDRIDTISYQEVKKLRDYNSDSNITTKRNLIFRLNEVLEDLIDDIKEEDAD